MSGKERQTPLLLKFPKTDSEIDILRPVNVVVNKLLFAQVGSLTQRVKANPLRNYHIGAQLCHQKSMSALLFSCFVETYRKNVHKSILHLNSCLRSSSPISPSHVPTSNGRLSLFDTGTHKKFICRPHYHKLKHIDFRDEQTNMFLHTVWSQISKLANSPTGWCYRST